MKNEVRNSEEPSLEKTEKHPFRLLETKRMHCT